MLLGQEDSLEEEMATLSSVLVWRIPRTEEPGRLQSMGHNWSDLACTITPSIFLSHLNSQPVTHCNLWHNPKAHFDLICLVIEQTPGKPLPSPGPERRTTALHLHSPHLSFLPSSFLSPLFSAATILNCLFSLVFLFWLYHPWVYYACLNNMFWTS